MNTSTINTLSDLFAETFSRRTALAGLAGGATAFAFPRIGNARTDGSASSSGAASAAVGAAPDGAEILWDTWGTPHIFAEDAAGLFYAFGWAQAHNHGDLLLQLYSQARGRSAEIYGEEFLLWDRITRTMGLHERGAIWYDEQSPEFRSNLDAFAAGINGYAERHGDKLAATAKEVLPVDATDVLGHIARVFALFMSVSSGVLGAEFAGSMPGSNGWAVSPSRTADGHALLLANPHLKWSGEQTFFEAQLQAPGVYNAYGAAMVGFPTLMIAFNDQLGWTHTANTTDSGDLYPLTIEGDGYRFDDSVLPFETRSESIKVRLEDGSFDESILETRRSVHGPVVEIEGNTIAIRVAATDNWSSAAGIAEQWWDMGRATNLDEFESAVRRLQIPYFTVLYADRAGHVMSVFNGQTPVRPEGEFDWSGVVPGDTSATLWSDIHPYDDLPKVLDPEGGFVQNSNSPPWYTASPLALDPTNYPSYMAPQYLHWRERHGIRLLAENSDLTLERLVEFQQSTRMEIADALLDDLMSAVAQFGDTDAKNAAAVLANWDRQAQATSTGTLLFISWLQAMESTDPERAYDLFSTPWNPAEPLTMPSGLADPQRAVLALSATAGRIQALFGRLDVPWGDIARMQRGTFDLPANGCDGEPVGTLRVLWVDYSTLESSKQVFINGGDSYVAAVEFGDEVKARVLMTYGNASQPGSSHLGDQLVLSSRGEMRTPWRTRAEIESNLEEHEVLT